MTDGTRRPLVGYPAEAGTGEASLVLVRSRPDDPVGSARLGALIAADGPHAQRLVDVGTAPNGDTVLVLVDDPVRLPDLLLRPGGLTPGESVTVLVPLAEAIGTAHAAGAAHGALSAAAVRLAADGRPVLHDWDTAVLAELHGPAAFAAAAERDRAALQVLAANLLGDRAPAGLAGMTPEAAADALFAVADPEPVRLDAEPPDRALPVSWPGRLGAPASAAVPTARRRRLRAIRDAPALLAAASGAPAGLRAVRPRVWGAAAASVALLVAALVLLPGRGADAIGSATSTSSRALPAPRRSAPTATPAVAVAPRSLPATEAAARLLRARAACTTPTCLGTVDAAGSPVRSSDDLALRTGLPASPPATARIRSVSVVGAATVLDVGASAARWTVLVVREPDGWRLRDVVRPAPDVGR